MVRLLSVFVPSILIACGGNDSSPAKDTHDQEVTLDKAELAKMEPAEACKEIQKKLVSCKPTFDRVMTASAAGRTGPDDAFAAAWIQAPITAEMAGTTCTEETSEWMKERVSDCYSNRCRAFVECLMGGMTTGFELACPGGTYAMFSGRDDRHIGYCAKPDGTPHGPMVVTRKNEVFIRGEFQDGKRDGTFHWETRGSTITYEDGRATRVNGVPPEKLKSEPDGSFRMIGAAIVGPPEAFNNDQIGEADFSFEQDNWEPCVEPKIGTRSFPDGQIRTSFRVDKDGTLSQIEVEAYDAETAKCVEELLSSANAGDFLEEAEDIDHVDVRVAWVIRSKPPGGDEDED